MTSKDCHGGIDITSYVKALLSIPQHLSHGNVIIIYGVEGLSLPSYNRPKS